VPEIGVRELKAKASEIVREVRERNARYVITHRGRPVGVLVPLGEASTEPSEADVWGRLVRLGNEIAEGWPSGLSSGDVLSDMRR
jgi:prevent-host-death family protein